MHSFVVFEPDVSVYHYSDHRPFDLFIIKKLTQNRPLIYKVGPLHEKKIFTTTTYYWFIKLWWY